MKEVETPVSGGSCAQKAHLIRNEVIRMICRLPKWRLVRQFAVVSRLAAIFVLLASALIVLPGCGDVDDTPAGPPLPSGYQQTPEGRVISDITSRLESSWQDDPVAARASAINWLRKHPMVEDVGLSNDGATIWIHFKSGIRSKIMDPPKP